LSPEGRTSLRHSVDFIEFGKIGCVEFDFVASVYRARRITRFYRRVPGLVFETKFRQLGHREVRTPCLGFSPGGLINLCLIPHLYLSPPQGVTASEFREDV